MRVLCASNNGFVLIENKALLVEFSKLDPTLLTVTKQDEDLVTLRTPNGGELLATLMACQKLGLL